MSVFIDLLLHTSQVAELQMEVDDLRVKLESVLRETENIREGREAEVEKVKSSVGYIQCKELCLKLVFIL